MTPPVTALAAAAFAGLLLLVAPATALVSPRVTSRPLAKRIVSPPITMERTFIMIKPDGVQRGLAGRIMTRFEDKGLFLVACKMCFAEESVLKEHYCHIQDKPFFPAHLDYMMSAPVMAMVWEGNSAVAAGRSLLGPTSPVEAAPGTIRGDFALEKGRNLCHGSDSKFSADREIELWFPERTDLLKWSPVSQSLVEEDFEVEKCDIYNPLDGSCMSGDAAPAGAGADTEHQVLLTKLQSFLENEKDSFEKSK